MDMGAFAAMPVSHENGFFTDSVPDNYGGMLVTHEVAGPMAVVLQQAVPNDTPAANPLLRLDCNCTL